MAERSWEEVCSARFTRLGFCIASTASVTKSRQLTWSASNASNVCNVGTTKQISRAGSLNKSCASRRRRTRRFASHSSSLTFSSTVTCSGTWESPHRDLKSFQISMEAAEFKSDGTASFSSSGDSAGARQPSLNRNNGEFMDQMLGSSNGNFGGNQNGGRGGDGDGEEGEVGSSSPRIGDREKYVNNALEEILKKEHATLGSLPPEIQVAVQESSMTPALLARYLELAKRPLTGLLFKLGPGFRTRILADPKFLFKIGVEEGIGMAGKFSAETAKRGDKFFEQLDFVMANVVMALIADFALVWLPAPTIRFGNVQVEPKSKLQRFLRGLPASCFQANPVGKAPFTVQQRLASYLVKSVQLFGVGCLSSATGTSITNAIIFVREKMDPEFENQNAPCPIAQTSLLYGLFMSTSSNTRYQLLNGVEQWIVDPALHSMPMVSKIATFVLRFGNTFWGSSQWVDFTRIMGVQKAKEPELSAVAPAGGLAPTAAQ